MDEKYIILPENRPWKQLVDDLYQALDLFDLVIHQKDLTIDQLHQLKKNLLSEWEAATFRANRIQKQLDQVFDLLHDQSKEE